MCLFALVIVMVGISRIYLGVHYASDVLGGFCVSIIWLVLYTKVIARRWADRVGCGVPLRSPNLAMPVPALCVSMLDW